MKRRLKMQQDVFKSKGMYLKRKKSKGSLRPLKPSWNQKNCINEVTLLQNAILNVLIKSYYDVSCEEFSWNKIGKNENTGF